MKPTKGEIDPQKFLLFINNLDVVNICRPLSPPMKQPYADSTLPPKKKKNFKRLYTARKRKSGSAGDDDRASSASPDTPSPISVKSLKSEPTPFQRKVAELPTAPCYPSKLHEKPPVFASEPIEAKDYSNKHGQSCDAELQGAEQFPPYMPSFMSFMHTYPFPPAYPSYLFYQEEPLDLSIKTAKKRRL